jgi:hypothetical protein
MTNKLTTEKKRMIRNHANRNIIYILDKLNVLFYDRGDGLIQACCPCQQHGGDRDNHTAWSWRIDLGKWVCWSHHCEESRGNDVFGLVSSVKGLNFSETIKWIINTLENKDVDIETDAPDPENLYRGVSLHIHEPMPEDNIKFLTPDPQYLLDRGFDLDVLRSYEVGLWSRVGTYMHDRAVFPVRDHDGHLVGYTGRTIHSKEYFELRSLQYKKWIHGRHYNRWPKRGDLFTGSILFNLYRAKRYINQSRRLILVEGPLDGMKLEEAGIRNWVATLGTNFCPAHRTLLVQHGISDLFVAYDGDDPSKYKDNQSPADRGWDRMQRIIGDVFRTHRVSMPIGQDCGDLAVSKLQEMFEFISC